MAHHKSQSPLSHCSQAWRAVFPFAHFLASSQAPNSIKRWFNSIFSPSTTPRGWRGTTSHERNAVFAPCPGIEPGKHLPRRETGLFCRKYFPSEPAVGLNKESGLLSGPGPKVTGGCIFVGKCPGAVQQISTETVSVQWEVDVKLCHCGFF